MEDTTTREQILAVARELFAEKGYDNTGITEIAQRVGITKSVIYYHFHNKEDILHTIIGTALKDIVAYKTSKAADPSDADTMIEDIIHMLTGYWSRNRDTARILMMESLKKGKDNPLLSFWKETMGVPNETIKSAYQVGSPERMVLHFFFMLFIPTICFTIFKDEWPAYTASDGTDTEMEQVIVRVCKMLLHEM